MWLCLCLCVCLQRVAPGLLGLLPPVRRGGVTQPCDVGEAGQLGLCKVMGLV
jgi:hypothetical protein